MNLYPVNLNIKDALCIIIGGGKVARRKIGELISCGAKIAVVSPEVGPAIMNLAKSGKIVWHARLYKQGDLSGAFLVFAATDNREVQQNVAAEALEKNILFNSVDDPDACSFQVPAKVRRGDFLLTVSTGGGSPALAAKLRRQLAEEYGMEYQKFVNILRHIRKIIVADGKNSQSHKILFEELLDLNILEQIRRQDWSALERDLQNVLPDEINVKALILSIQSPGQKLNE